MVQTGLNMGPRHARVLGWAKSFTKNLDYREKVMQDQEVIGATSLMWSLVQSAVPQKITQHVMQCLENGGLPNLATRNVEEGKYNNLLQEHLFTLCITGDGFQIVLDGQTFSFHTAKRAPPETYLARGYVAYVY